MDAIKKNIQQLRDQVIKIDTKHPVEELENTLLLETSEQNSRLAEFTKKQKEQTNLSLRANEIAQDLSTARANNTTIKDAVANQSFEDLSLLLQANYLKKQANIEKLSITLKV